DLPRPRAGAIQSGGAMRNTRLLFVGVMLVAAGAVIAQAQEAAQPVGTMGDLMTSMVYPAANDLLLSIARGGPKDDKEWMAAQRSAVLLARSEERRVGKSVDLGGRRIIKKKKKIKIKTIKRINTKITEV